MATMDSRRVAKRPLDVAILLTAGFGGISPNILRIGGALLKNQDPGVSAGYFVGLLLFAITGAVTALIWKEKDLKKAFYLGLGFPSLLQVATTSATQDQPMRTSSQEVRIEETCPRASRSSRLRRTRLLYPNLILLSLKRRFSRLP